MSVQVDSLDAKSRCRFSNYQSKHAGGGRRSTITEFSRQSRSRLIYKARNIPDLQTMITLTYPDELYSPGAVGGDFMADGTVVKDQLRKIRQWLTYRGFYGFWCLEFQARGAPHVHLFCHGLLSDGDVARLHALWFKMVGSSCPHHKAHGVRYEILRKKQAPAAYAAKYSAKSEQKVVPDSFARVGRFWGAFGNIPNEVVNIEVDQRQSLFDLVRLARRWSKADARANGYHLRKISGLGISGHSFYNCGSVLRAYLSRFYILPDTASQIVLRARPLPMFESQDP